MAVLPALLIIMITSATSSQHPCLQASPYSQNVSDWLTSPKQMVYEHGRMTQLICNDSDKGFYNYTYRVEGESVQTLMKNLEFWQTASDIHNNKLDLFPQNERATPLDVTIICYNDVTGRIGSVFTLQNNAKDSGNQAEMCPSGPRYRVLSCDVKGSRDCFWYLNDSLVLPGYNGSILVPGLHIPASNGTYSCVCPVVDREQDQPLSSVSGIFGIAFLQLITGQSECAIVKYSKINVTWHTTTLVYESHPSTVQYRSHIPPSDIITPAKISGSEPSSPKPERCFTKEHVVIAVLTTAVVITVIAVIVIFLKKRIHKRGTTAVTRRTKTTEGTPMTPNPPNARLKPNQDRLLTEDET